MRALKIIEGEELGSCPFFPLYSCNGCRSPLPHVVPYCVEWESFLSETLLMYRSNSGKKVPNTVLESCIFFILFFYYYSAPSQCIMMAAYLSQIFGELQ